MSAFKQSSSSRGRLKQKYVNLLVFLQLECLISNYHASSRKRATEEFFIWRCVWQFHKGVRSDVEFFSTERFFSDMLCYLVLGFIRFWFWRGMLQWRTWFRCGWLLWRSCVARWLLIVYQVSFQHFCIMTHSLHKDINKLLCTLNHFRTQNSFLTEGKHDSLEKCIGFRYDSLLHVKDLLPFPWILRQHSGFQCVQRIEYLLWRLLLARWFWRSSHPGGHKIPNFNTEIYLPSRRRYIFKQ